tara:strand:+ start:344 stop:709 length:366 start_codon:yes stop_codon:yes gene_type:complete
MKSTELKAMIKEAVKEAIGEELKEILLEAVKAPKSTAQLTHQPIAENLATPNPATKEKYASLLSGMGPGQTSLSMNSSHAQGFGQTPGYTPPASSNTTGQGSSLPPGEVNMNQIMGFINKK